MSNPYDPYSGEQPSQPPADPAAPTRFVPLGGPAASQPPQVPPQPLGYGGAQNSGGWARQQPQPQPGQPPYGAPQQSQTPAFGAPPQQQPFGGYPAPTPMDGAKAKRGNGARIVGGLFGSIVGRVIVGVLIVGGVAVYHFATDNSAKRDNSGQVSQSGSLGISDLKTGDCFNAPAGDTGIESVTAIPCTSAHDSQVYAEPKITESSYPDTTALEKEANDACNSADNVLDASLPSDVSASFYAAQDSATFDQGFNFIICTLDSSSKNLTKSYVTGS